MYFKCQSKSCWAPCTIKSGSKGTRADAALTAQCPWGHKRGVSFKASPTREYRKAVSLKQARAMQQLKDKIRALHECFLTVGLNNFTQKGYDQFAKELCEAAKL